MASHIDELKLLDLIEGELDSASAAVLRGQVADDPKTLARLARMEGDRHELRSLAEPELPPALRSQLETLLARPMLIETERPGAYRRQQRRINRQKRLKQLAVAASVALVSAAGMWMFASTFVPQITGAINRAMFAQRGSSDESAADKTPVLAAKSNANQPAPARTITAVELAAITKSDDVVHHYLPQPVSLDEFVIDQPGVVRKADDNTRSTAVATTVVTAPFSIMVQSRDSSAVEQAMVAVVRESGQDAGLVRNFSYTEARRLEDEWRIANAGRRTEGEPMAADAGRSPSPNANSTMLILADRVRQRFEQRQLSGPGEARTSGLIVGTSQHVPSLEQQLEFSSQGATHTVMVSAHELTSMLSKLGQSSGHMTWLRMNQPDATAQGPRPAAQVMPGINEWMQQAPLLRSAAEQLVRDHADSMILVPVIVVPQK